MKKMLALIMTVILAIPFAACTGGNPETPTNGSTPSAEQDNNTAADEPSEESAVAAFCNGKFNGRETLSLVALGDSIARGYGLSNPETQAYPSILSKSIESVLDGISVDCTNYAVDGMKTDGLLKLLNDGAPKLSQADIVVISIGANNILGPFLEAVGALNYTNNGNSSDTGVVESFIEQLNGLIKSEAFIARMNTGISTARKELPQIIKRVKAIAPGAVVALSTVYSPYHGINLSLPYLKQSVALGEQSDKWVSLLNEEIRNACNAEGCVLVDTYDSFAEAGNLVNASISLMPPRFSFDPHPNINGHIKLSNLHLSALQNMQETE